MLKLIKREIKINLQNAYANSQNNEKKDNNEKKYDENDIKKHKIAKKY